MIKNNFVRNEIRKNERESKYERSVIEIRKNLKKLERYTQDNEKKEQKARKISIENKLMENMKIRTCTIESVSERRGDEEAIINDNITDKTQATISFHCPP